jgi:hypothetical protein
MPSCGAMKRQSHNLYNLQRFDSAFDSGTANANAILLIDRQLNEVVLSDGTDNPEKVANSYGWCH